MRVHHGGKNGDLIYSLPVIKALSRVHGKITLVTSPLCFQLVPLLWEQPYLQDVEMDYSQAYKIDDHGCMDPWQVLSPEEGINLSPQPAMFRHNAPVSWTHAYAEIAGIGPLTVKDRVALPSLWNHRQWFWEHNVETEGKDKVTRTWKPPLTCVLAPESETLKTIPLRYWWKVAAKLQGEFTVIVVGAKPDGGSFGGFNLRDLRGLTTVPSMARILAEATLVIAANSLPWHLARHAGTPTFCFQDQYIERCTPVDTPYAFYTAEQWERMAEDAILFAKKPVTTLWNPKDLKELEAA